MPQQTMVKCRHPAEASGSSVCQRGKSDVAEINEPAAQAPCEFHCWVCSDRKRCIYPLYHSGSHECPVGHRW